MAKAPKTAFKKGQSGNPGGRPKVVAEVQELAREYTTDAMETLASIARDSEQPAAARVSAANSILDRGYGKPPQSVDVTHKRGIAELSDAELAEIASLATRGSDGDTEQESGAISPDSVH